MKSIKHLFQNEEWKEFLLVAGTTLLLLCILLLRTEMMTYKHPDFAKPWDHHEYIKMAQGNPFESHSAPYCWRILNPLMAKILPFDLQWNFLIISFISIWLTGIGVYYLSKIFTYSKVFGYVGVFMFFSLGWATKFVLYDFWLPDSLSFLFITLTIYCILAKKDMLFSILLFIGVLVKESVIFTAPLYYTFNARKLIDLKLAKRMLSLILPAVLILLFMRVLIPGTNVITGEQDLTTEIKGAVQSDSGSYDYFHLWGKIGWERIKNFSPIKISYVSLITFGFMLIALPFFSARRNIILFLKFLPFLLLICSQLLFATNTERLLVAGFPAAILLALNGVDAISNRLRVKADYFLLLPLFIFGLNLFDPKSFHPPLGLQTIVFILYLVLIYIIRTKKVNYKLL
jgi:hypothetical protein